MAFPDTPLPIKVELQLGSVWTDVTSDVRAEQQIRISRGRSDEGQQVDTTRCSFTLDNNTSKYSPKNPSGPYYGRIGRNTPVRVSVLTGSSYLNTTGAIDRARAADTAALDITGDIDVRVEVQLEDWTSNALPTELCGKYNANAGERSWLLTLYQGKPWLYWSADGSAENAIGSSDIVSPPPNGNMALRVTLDVDNGAAGRTATFYTAPSINGPWTQLGTPTVQAGTTSIHANSQPLDVGAVGSIAFPDPTARYRAFELRNGINGTLVASPDFTIQTPGATSFVDSAGVTWTLDGAASITNRQPRFVGEVTSWAPRWETKVDVVTQIEASGVLRRLTQGASPLRSAMYREFTNPSRTGIVGYWPMEDDAGATSFASGLSAQPAIAVPSSGVSLAAYSDWPASAPLPTFTFATSRGRITPYTATNYIFARFFTAVPAGGVSGTDRLFTLVTTGTARTWSVWIQSGGALDLRAYDADGAQIFATGFLAFGVNGKPMQIGVELTQTGADISVTLVTFDINASTLTQAAGLSQSATLTANTVGSATEVRIGESGLLNGTAIGHIAVANSNTAYANTIGAVIGWRGELAGARVLRLSTEEQITAGAASTGIETIGAQGRTTLVDLLREAEAAEEGILYEGRSHLGFKFRNHTSLNNQTPALTLDYTGTSGLVTPLEPTDDDQQVRNDITVARTDGSSSRLTLDTGTLSTQAPPNGVGRYTDSVTLNLFDDARTLDHAGWRLHVGTWDETRYPVVHMVLSKVPSMLEQVAGVDVGDRIQITNPPSWLPPDTIDLMVQGYTEVLDQFTWNLDFNCTPAGPWDIAWAGDDATATAEREFQWIDTDGSQLAEALTTTETDVDVLTTAGPVWTPNVADTPFDWRVGGEVMTVTAPGSLLNTNPFFDVDTTGWTQQNATFTRSQTYVCPHPRATASLRIVPDGVNAVGGALNAHTPVDSITPGATYTASMWVFSTNGWSDIQPAINWYTSADVFISTSSGPAMAVPSSVWTYLERTFTAPANAARAEVRPRHSGTPTAGDIYYVWAARITRVKSSTVYDAFGRTSTDTWGLADSGQTWTNVGGVAADYDVLSGYGRHINQTSSTGHHSLITAPHPDFDIYCDITTAALSTGASQFAGIIARYTDADNLYEARVDFTTSNAINLTIRKRVAAVETQLGTFSTLLTHAAGTYVRVRFQGLGTALKAKIWQPATADEPASWAIEVTDSAITAAGSLGVKSVRNAGNTNVNAELRFDNYELINPQTFTVTRSVNGVTKTQPAGTAVQLATPATTAL